MQKYAVAGYPILHSLSPKIHNTIYQKLQLDAKYIHIVSKSPDNVYNLSLDLAFDGLNITAPFKSEYSNQIDCKYPIINTIRLSDDKGFNTDTLALKDLIKETGYNDIVILGGGATAFSTALAATELNKKVIVLSRNPDHINKALILNSVEYKRYEDFKREKKRYLFVSTLPANHNVSLKNLEIQNGDYIIDSLYFNNSIKDFASKKGILYKDGIDFLIKQAIYAHNLWSSPCKEIYSEIKSNLSANTQKSYKIALIGFMGVGKTSIANDLSALLSWQHYDIDHIIEKRTNKSISDIFAHEGEENFRKEESKILHELSQKKHCIVSCGGGIVEKVENLHFLESFDHVLWIYRDLKSYQNKNDNSNRPLWKDDVLDLFDSRKEKYFKACTAIVDNTTNYNETLSLLEEELLRYYAK